MPPLQAQVVNCIAPNLYLSEAASNGVGDTERPPVCFCCSQMSRAGESSFLFFFFRKLKKGNLVCLLLNDITLSSYSQLEPLLHCCHVVTNEAVLL